MAWLIYDKAVKISKRETIFWEGVFLSEEWDLTCKWQVSIYTLLRSKDDKDDTEERTKKINKKAKSTQVFYCFKHYQQYVCQ